MSAIQYYGSFKVATVFPSSVGWVYRPARFTLVEPGIRVGIDCNHDFDRTLDALAVRPACCNGPGWG